MLERCSTHLTVLSAKQTARQVDEKAVAKTTGFTALKYKTALIRWASNIEKGEKIAIFYNIQKRVNITGPFTKTVF